jgi:hypothetical protein
VGDTGPANGNSKPTVNSVKIASSVANQPAQNKLDPHTAGDLRAVEAAANSNESHPSVVAAAPKVPPQKRELALENTAAAPLNKTAQNTRQIAETKVQVGQETQGTKSIPAVQNLDQNHAAAPLVVSAAAREASLRGQIAQLEQLNATLESRLEEVKVKLMLAETQVERLSAIIDQRGDDDLRRFGGSSSRQPAGYGASGRPRVAEMPPAMDEGYARQGSRVIAMPDNGGEQPMRQAPRQGLGSAVSSAPSLMPASRVDTDRDTPIATVVSKKALVRSGPSESEAVLSTLATGAKVTVETQQGNWFRVIAPDGVRVWISAYDIAFGDTASVPATGKKALPPSSSVGAPQGNQPQAGGRTGQGESEEDTVNQAMELLRQAGAE